MLCTKESGLYGYTEPPIDCCHPTLALVTSKSDPASLSLAVSLLCVWLVVAPLLAVQVLGNTTVWLPDAPTLAPDASRVAPDASTLASPVTADDGPNLYQLLTTLYFLFNWCLPLCILWKPMFSKSPTVSIEGLRFRCVRILQ